MVLVVLLLVVVVLVVLAVVLVLTCSKADAAVSVPIQALPFPSVCMQKVYSVTEECGISPVCVCARARARKGKEGGRERGSESGN